MIARIWRGWTSRGEPGRARRTGRSPARPRVNREMTLQVMWSGWSSPLLEHLRLTRLGDSVVADGVIVGVKDEDGLRVRYRVMCDPAWRVREAEVGLLDGDNRSLGLRSDGAGRWTTAAGAALPELAGCVDVDIAATPFTNTLPIRRLRLAQGQAAEVRVAYVAVPELRVTPVAQRYTCLRATPDGGLYRYENLTSYYRADLPVDEDGLVLDYPEQRRRVWFR